MKTFLLLFLVAIPLSFADHADLDTTCPNKSDAVCVGKVILNQLKDMGPLHGVFVVQYYNEDDCSGELLAVTRNATDQVCRDKALFVTKKVWGIRINGKCENIRDDEFLHVCLTFGVH